MTYLFFITKASLVRLGHEHRKWFTRVGFATKWGLIIFIPFFVGPVAGTTASGIVTADGVCVLYLTQLWFPALFILGNIALSAALLFLFVFPLRQHAKNTRSVNHHVSEKMLAVAKRNARLTYVMICVSTVSVIGTCVVTALAGKDPAAYQWALLFLYAATVIDVVVCCGCARNMTNIWMPSWFKSRFPVTPSSSTKSSDPHVIANVTPLPQEQIVESPMDRRIVVSSLPAATRLDT